MLGLQGIVNPLLAGSQGPTAAVPTAANLNGFGTGQNGGVGTSQATSFPPGFAPPGLAQRAPPPPVVNHTVDIGQRSQSIPPAPASLSSVAAGSNEPVSSQQVSTTSGDDVSLYGQAAVDSMTPAHNQTPPISVTSSTHSVENLTHSVAATSRATRPPESSSVSFSSQSEDSSSLSSEGETLQSSRKLNHVTGATTNADSCATDSSESEGGHAKKLNNGGGGGAVNGGAVTECLFYSGGARSPAWAKEKAFIKR